ncbi:MAG: response regulator [Sandaracinus sp.]|nr:response regulator [Sandaracinus sp.]
MPVKILAVDDSATMRKIMETTFAGEDAEVVTASSGQEAVTKAKQLQPDVVFADASMDGMDGYAVAQAIKSDGGLAKTAVIVLASQHTPYDEARGKSSGVDDHVAKPFDSQVVIDKVADVLSKPRATASGAPAAATPPAAPAPASSGPGPQQPAAPRSPKRTMAFGTPSGGRPPMPKPPAPAAPPKPPAPEKPVLELADDAELVPATPAPAKPAAPPKPAAPAKPPAAAKPAPKPPTPAAPPKPAAKPAPAKPAAAAAAATSSGGDMAAKLADLGLSKDQVEGVLALSREVIEQVVWEVVPDLAETLIKEEIQRLMAE